MKRMFFTAVLLVFSAAAFAAVNPSAEIMLPILDIGVGARACAMGGAFAAGADDASAVFWNPAGLSGVKSVEIALTYDSWFMGSFYSHMLAAVPAGPGTIAADVIYLNGGDFPDVDMYGVPTGTSTQVSSIGGLLAYGMNIAGGFSAGLTAKFLNQTTGPLSGYGIAADIGMKYDADMVKAGLNVRNIGTAGSYSLPMSVNGGVEILPLKNEQHVLSIEIDGKYLFKDAPWIMGGVEYSFQKMFSIRAGYSYRIGQDSLSGIAGLSAGAGFNINNIKLDYAFVPYGDLGTAHRATLSYMFGSQAQPQPVSPNKAGKIDEIKAALAEAAMLEKEGKLDKAAAKLRAAVIDAPQNADLWNKLGMIYYKDRKKANAIKAFETYLKLNPSDVKIRDWLKKYRK